MAKTTTVQRRLRLIFLVDIHGWAFDLIAKNLQEKLASHFDIEILYWDDYASYDQVLHAIIKKKVDHLHFFFREHLQLILETAIPGSREMIALRKIIVSTHIPDYLYSSLGELVRRTALFSYVDGYFTTNSDLFHIYSESKIIRKPDAVIFDWPNIPVSPWKDDSTDGAIRIAWCGNSEWGAYAGHVDYKGLQKVILPAIAQIKSRNPNVQFLCMDSAHSKISHEDVLKNLARTDILLIASVAEGTPLTFIEGIAASCAVVSTQVGIVKEVLHADQHRYIVPRSSAAFSEAIGLLVDDRGALSEAKRQNYESYLSGFGSESPLLDKWLSFLAIARTRHAADGDARKTAALHYGAGRVRGAAIRVARRSVSLVKKWGLVQAINDISPAIGVAYNKLLHGGGEKVVVDNSVLEVAYDQIFSDLDLEKPIIVYAPMWKGVAASTESLFHKNLVRFPFLDSVYPEVSHHQFLDRFCEKLEGKKPRSIIYSGGSALHLEVAEILRKKNPQISQYFLWHGSPAQWVEPSQFKHFLSWESLHRNNVIDGMITVKLGLEKTLQGMGINAYSICNPIPNLAQYKKTLAHKDGTQWGIGVFSAFSSWYKNPYVQVLSLAGMSDVCLHTNLHKSQFDELSLGIGEIRSYPHMPRNQFLSVLSDLDINLYVTNTECSPMVALECWAMNVPCIVGPAGDIYSSTNARLGEYLVETKVDHPGSLADRIGIVRENIDEIRSLLESNVDKYNALTERYFEQMIASI